MIAPPPWRTRATPRRRAAAAAVTFAIMAAIGCGLMALTIVFLGWAGAPWLVTAAPWYVPTVAAVAWNLRRPTPATAGDDGDESWMLYAIRAVLVGAEERRSRPARLVTAGLFGAPIAWCLLVLGGLTLAGVA